MNCQVHEYKSYNTPTLAGNFRFLLGLVLIFAGAYLATLTNIKGHGLGFLLILASPFLILTDDK
ncbi:MAG: hypothetical protein ABI891_09000 [Acidobacteriota bacterium]